MIGLVAGVGLHPIETHVTWAPQNGSMDWNQRPWSFVSTSLGSTANSDAKAAQRDKETTRFSMEAQFYGEYHGDVLWGYIYIQLIMLNNARNKDLYLGTTDLWCWNICHSANKWPSLQANIPAPWSLYLWVISKSSNTSKDIYIYIV